MIKKHGVALTQFVICGNTSLLIEYMTVCSKDNRLDFLQEFFMLEDVLNAEPLVIEDYMPCIEYGITPSDYKKMKRYYTKKPNIPWTPPLSESEFTHLREAIGSSTIVLPNGFDTSDLTPSQIYVASRVFKYLGEYYKAFGFADMKNFKGETDISKLFGVSINNIYKVLEAYKKFGALNIIRRMHLILCKLLASMEDVTEQDAAQGAKLMHSIQHMQSSLSDLSKLFGEELPPLTTAEMAVVWLRLNEAGVIGIDNVINNGIKIKTKNSMVYNIQNKETHFLYKLLEKDMHSVIAENWGTRK